MEITKFLKLVDEFGVLIIPFEKAPKEIRELTDGIGSHKSKEPDEGEVIIYHKDATTMKFDKYANENYYIRIMEFADLLSVADFQRHEYGDYIVEITAKMY